jgi:hypothetical protein
LDETFRNRIREVRQQYHERQCGLFASTQCRAVLTLDELATKSKSEGIRLRAASKIAELSLRVREIDIVAEVATLRQEVEALKASVRGQPTA